MDRIVIRGREPVARLVTHTAPVGGGGEPIPGPPNVLTIGEVVEGDTARVVITGDSPAQVINFEIPRGRPGEPGKDGDPGRDGTDADPAIVAALRHDHDALAGAVANLLSGSLDEMNSMIELSQAMNNDPEFGSKVILALGQRVRFDAAQALTATERNVARSNIDAASLADLGGKLPRDAYVRSLQVIASGKPPASSLIGGAIVPQAGAIDLDASAFACDVAPTNAVTLSIKRNGADLGSVTFAAGSKVGSINLSATALNAGDRLTFHMGAVDATFASILGALVVRL